MIAVSPSSFLNSSSLLILNPRIDVDVSSPSPAPARFRSPPSRFVAAAAAAAYTSSAERTRTPHQLSFSPKMASYASLYETLEIPMGASYQEIKDAYRRLARACHPDVVAVNRKDTSANEFMKIHTAYSTLSDPEKRADYDRKLFRRKRPFCSTSASSSSMSGIFSFTRRNWETDQCW